MSETMLAMRAAERRRRQVVTIVTGGICLLTLLAPLVMNNYILFVFETIFSFILIALGLNLLVGYLGELAFASAGLVGLGAYGTGLLIAHFGVDLWLSLFGGVVCGCIGGVLVGGFALRVTRYYLVIATLAFGEILRWFYVHVSSITYGSGGFTVPEQHILGMTMAGSTKYYFIFSITVLALIGTKLLLNSRFGRAFIAIRDNKYAAEAGGIQVRRMKMIAYIWSGALSGLAGAMTVYINEFVDPQSYGMVQVLTHFSMVMVGGIGSFVGSIVGAVLLAALPAVLSGFPGLEQIIFSVLIVAIIVGFPTGLGGWISKVMPVWKERRFRV